MERKLLDLKEEFCKWYCPNKGVIVTRFIGLCEECQVGEFIRFVRDELK